MNLQDIATKKRGGNVQREIKRKPAYLYHPKRGWMVERAYLYREGHRFVTTDSATVLEEMKRQECDIIRYDHRIHGKISKTHKVKKELVTCSECGLGPTAPYYDEHLKEVVSREAKGLERKGNKRFCADCMNEDYTPVFELNSTECVVVYAKQGMLD